MVYVDGPEDIAPAGVSGHKHTVVRATAPGPNGELYCWFQCTVKGGREGREIDAVAMAVACEILGAGEIVMLTLCLYAFIIFILHTPYSILHTPYSILFYYR
jgi:hypothetical protein